MTSQPVQKTIAIHILTNISRSKGQPSNENWSLTTVQLMKHIS